MFSYCVGPGITTEKKAMRPDGPSPLHFVDYVRTVLDYVYMPSAKRYLSLSDSKKGVVSTSFDIVAGFMLGAALPDDDSAGCDRLTSILLSASVLGITIPTVGRGTLSLFMCHLDTPGNSCFCVLGVWLYRITHSFPVNLTAPCIRSCA